MGIFCSLTHDRPRPCTAHFPNASKASEDLVKFAKLNDNRLYKLLRTMLEPQTELKSLLKAHVRERLYPAAMLWLTTHSKNSFVDSAKRLHR